MPKMNFGSFPAPAVQFAGQRKVRVAAQGDRPGMRAHQLDRAVDPRHAAFMAGHVAGAIDQIEHFIGIGQ
jgi:hypothetical protein